MIYDGHISARAPLMRLPDSALPKPKEKARPKGEPPKWETMTEDECRMAIALGKCSLRAYALERRIVPVLAERAKTDNPTITEGLRRMLHVFVWRYRRQLPRDILELRRKAVEKDT